MAKPDLYFDGTLSLAGVRDDNLFYTAASRESDTITRLTPGFATGSRSDRLTLGGRWGLDIERFAEHSELDTNRAREAASADLRARLGSPVTFTLHGDYLSTLTPGELNLTTGLSEGRARARRFSAGPAFLVKGSPATDMSFGYTLTKDDLAGGVSGDTRTLTAGLVHRLSARTSTTADYSYSRYAFAGSAPIDVQTLTLGWERKLSPTSSFALRAGPRYSEGRFDPEATLSLQHGSGKIDTSLVVGRSLGTVIGQSGTFVTDSAAVGVTFKPIPALRFGIGPAVYRTRDDAGGPGTRVYSGTLDASWRISDWLSLVGTYRRNVQRGALASSTPGPAVAGEEIARDTIYLGLVGGRSEPRPVVRTAGAPEGSR